MGREVSGYIRKKPLRWFYVALSLTLTAASFGIFYVGAHYDGWRRVVIFIPAAFLCQLVPRMLRAAWTGEHWRI
jgi:hypothetical protein